MRVGWIGLGRVGQQMAISALAGGHELIGHSRRFEQHREVEAAGGVLTGSVLEAARDVDILCINVFSGEQLRDAVVDGGVMAVLPTGALVAVHSTVPPELIAEVAALRPDVHVVDAGFSGSADDARHGRLTLMIGGDPDAIARAEPVFRCYAANLAHVGPSGAGMTMKILNNLLFAAHMSLGREAIRAAARQGIAMHDALAVLQQGSAASFALGNYQRGRDADEMYEQSRPYMVKDVAIAVGAFPELTLLTDATADFLVEPAPRS